MAEGEELDAGFNGYYFGSMGGGPGSGDAEGWAVFREPHDDGTVSGRVNLTFSWESDHGPGEALFRGPFRTATEWEEWD